jgi:hypothetical protein
LLANHTEIASKCFSFRKVVFHYADGLAIFFHPSQKSTRAICFCLASCTRAFCGRPLKAESEREAMRITAFIVKTSMGMSTFLRTGTHNRYNIRPYPEKAAAAFNSNTARRLQTGRAYTYRLQRCTEDKVEKRERENKTQQRDPLRQR